MFPSTHTNDTLLKIIYDVLDNDEHKRFAMISDIADREPLSIIVFRRKIPIYSSGNDRVVYYMPVKSEYSISGIPIDRAEYDAIVWRMQLQDILDERQAYISCCYSYSDSMEKDDKLDD